MTMGVDGRIMESMIVGLLFLGALIGLGIAGLVWLFFWLFSHIDVSWIGGA